MTGDQIHAVVRALQICCRASETPPKLLVGVLLGEALIICLEHGMTPEEIMASVQKAIGHCQDEINAGGGVAARD